MTVQECDLPLILNILQNLKVLLSNDQKEENSEFVIKDCIESLSVFNLLLLMAPCSKSEDGIQQQIT
jgi:hypothetical protein